MRLTRCGTKSDRDAPNTNPEFETKPRKYVYSAIATSSDCRLRVCGKGCGVEEEECSNV